MNDINSLREGCSKLSVVQVQTKQSWIGMKSRSKTVVMKIL